jgi:outer membrane protein OmpA-like peptidoglycan-associated protein
MRRPRFLCLWLAGCVGALLFTGSAAHAATTIAEAQAAVEAARSTRAVRALAAPELDAAERALERALAARDAGQARAEVEHLAYLAERRAAIARMQAKERQIARALRSLSATHAMITEARALEAAAVQRRTLALAQRLQRFEVRPDGGGLLLTPRAAWFEAGLAPSPQARRAAAEAAALLAKLPERKVEVRGYATRPASHAAMRVDGAGAPAPDQPAVPPAAAAATPATDPNDPACVRAEIVRAFLISHGVDPRRVVATCVAAAGGLETSPASPAGPSAGETAIAILPEENAARAPLLADLTDPAATRW